MSQGRLSGYAWHVEKVKGNYFKRKTCFNCIFFDEQACIKYNIYITNNNAIYCKSYKRSNNSEIEKNTNKNPYSYMRIKKAQQIINEINSEYNKIGQNKNIQNYVKYGDVVILEIINSENDFIKLEIRENLTGKEKVLKKNCLNQRINHEFNYKRKSYRIIKIEKNVIPWEDRKPIIVKNDNKRESISNTNNSIYSNKKIDTKKVKKIISKEEKMENKKRKKKNKKNRIILQKYKEQLRSISSLKEFYKKSGKKSDFKQKETEELKLKEKFRKEHPDIVAKEKRRIKRKLKKKNRRYKSRI